MAFYTLRNSRSVVATLRPLAFAKAEDQTVTHRWLSLSLPPLVLFPALLFRDQPCEDTEVLLIFLYMHLLDIIGVTLDEEEEGLAAVEMQLFFFF